MKVKTIIMCFLGVLWIIGSIAATIISDDKHDARYAVIIGTIWTVAGMFMSEIEKK
jgi:hypothetical protein